MMFRVVAGFVFIFIIWWINWVFRTIKPKIIIEELGKSDNGPQLNIMLTFGKLLYLITLLFVLILAITGLFHPLILGKPITGFLLMLHVAIAPIFAVTLAIGCLLWAFQHRFNMMDLQWLEEIKNSWPIKIKKEIFVSQTFLKFLFWLGMVLSIPVILSIVLSMYRYFGTDGQVILFTIHRYSAVAFLIDVLIYTFLVLSVAKQKQSH